MKILVAYRTPNAVVVLSTRAHDQARQRVSELFGPAAGIWIALPFAGIGNRVFGQALARELGPVSLLQDGQLGPVAVARVPRDAHIPDLSRIARRVAQRLRRERMAEVAAAPVRKARNTVGGLTWGRLRLGFAR